MSLHFDEEFLVRQVITSVVNIPSEQTEVKTNEVFFASDKTKVARR